MTALARIGRTIAGATLILLGLVLIPLPGPGVLVILAGLVVLAKDYQWARRMADRIRQRIEHTAQLARRRLPLRSQGPATTTTANEGDQS